MEQTIINLGKVINGYCEHMEKSKYMTNTHTLNAAEIKLKLASAVAELRKAE